MKRAIWGSAAAIGLLAASFTVNAGASPSSDRAAAYRPFHQVDKSRVGKITKPANLDPNAIVTATVQLTGDGVITAQTKARDAGQQFDESAAENAVRDQQSAVEGSLASAGAEVTGNITHVLNAVEIRVKASDLNAVAATPGVAQVQVSRPLTLDNAAADNYTGTPQAWQDLGLTGKGLTIGIIDDGLDYYHADFGGSGNPADYAADDHATIESGTFPTAKVVGGFDFVGDAYDAQPDALGESNVPVPDPDPVACGEHGTHVSGTAAGAGVLADGSTFAGPYDSTTLSANNFTVAPGSAPEASIRIYKVFGCAGSVNDDIVIAAIDRAVADGVDVINMSLGSPFGIGNDVETAAIDAATAAGVLVVASAGNDGPSAYMTGSPASANTALSVAANDAEFPILKSVAVTGAVTDTAQNSNLAPIPAPITQPLVDVKLGCALADYATAVGKIALATRGTCARVDRAILAQQAGAVAVIMINNSAGLPPVEGPIPGVTIPFVGVDFALSATYLAQNGKTVTLDNGPDTPNPGFSALASFSSGGPRRLDNAPKPDVTAPGVAVLSAGVGTGTEGVRLSGTSMSSPHTAGIALLVRQGHPTWGPLQAKAALQSTADPTIVSGYDSRSAGTGAVQARRATDTLAYLSTADGRNNITFGFRQIGESFEGSRSFTINNASGQPLTYDLSTALSSPSLGENIGISPSTVRVPAGASRNVQVNLRLNRAAVRALPGATAPAPGQITSLGGAIVATPRVTAAGIYSLRILFNFVPQGLSNVRSEAGRIRNGTGTVRLRNEGTHSGDADFYQWIATDAAGDVASPETADIIDVGAQAFDAGPSSPGDKFIVLAVNQSTASSTQATHEIDASVDTNRDGIPDRSIVVVDSGLLQGSNATGTLWVVIFDSKGGIVDIWDAVTPGNSSTVLLPMLASDLGSDATTGAFSIQFEGGNVLGITDADLVAAGQFDPFNSSVSTGDFVTLAGGGRSSVPVTADASRSPLGWLVVTVDDAGGVREADRVRAIFN
jgi:minor extracellular serine protease Vpr